MADSDSRKDNEKAYDGNGGVKDTRKWNSWGVLWRFTRRSPSPHQPSVSSSSSTSDESSLSSLSSINVGNGKEHVKLKEGAGMLGGCPTDHGNRREVKSEDGSESSSSSGGCPVEHKAGTSSSSDGDQYNPLVGDMRFGQGRSPGQMAALSTHREKSSIEKSTYTPEHQPAGEDVWVYPSEQQYFNAMKRKGWKPQEQDIPFVLAIHNAVNEQGWKKVREWEALHRLGWRGLISSVSGSGGATPNNSSGGIGSSSERQRSGGVAAAAPPPPPLPSPKLLKFMGRPKDISPKAWIKSNLLGYQAPFDRHDWVIDRDGERVRYVIDFYTGKARADGADAGKPVPLYLDVRPALDSVDAGLDRALMVVKEEMTPMFLEAQGLFKRMVKAITGEENKQRTGGGSKSCSGGSSVVSPDDRPLPPVR